MEQEPWKPIRHTEVESQFKKNDILTAIEKKTGRRLPSQRFKAAHEDGLSLIWTGQPTDIPLLFTYERFEFELEQAGQPDSPLKYKKGDVFRELETGDLIEIVALGDDYYSWKCLGEYALNPMAMREKNLDDYFEPVSYFKQVPIKRNKMEDINSRLKEFERTLQGKDIRLKDEPRSDRGKEIDR